MTTVNYRAIQKHSITLGGQTRLRDDENPIEKCRAVYIVKKDI